MLHVTYSVIVAAERRVWKCVRRKLQLSYIDVLRIRALNCSEEIIISVLGCKVYQIEIWLRAHAVERRCISVSQLTVCLLPVELETAVAVLTALTYSVCVRVCCPVRGVCVWSLVCCFKVLASRWS